MLFHRINPAAAALVTPVVTKIVAQGVREGAFAAFDLEGLAEMLLQLGSSSHSIVARAIATITDEDRMEEAIDALERRLQLYEIALDRILGLADGSVRLADPGCVHAVMTARPRA